MNDKKERFFDYAKALESAKHMGRKNQREISEELNVTEVHVSKIANEKSTTTLAKTLKILNDFDLCIDDFVEEPYRTSVRINYEDKKLFGGHTDEEIILLVEYIKKVQQVRKQQHLFDVEDNKKIAKLVGRRIRQLRKERNIPEEAIAEALAMQPDSYRNIESGTGTVMDNYVIIAKILNVPMGILFADFVKNKKSIMQYEMGELFQELDMQERKVVKEFLDMVSVLRGNNG